MLLFFSHQNKPWSYYGRPDSPPIMIKAAKKRQRPSRFDDEFGAVHTSHIDRKALRHLFAKKTERENLEKYQRANIAALHEHKCKFLCLDPNTTPLFKQQPEYYFNPAPDQRKWFQFPQFNGRCSDNDLPQFHRDNNYPRMANMPVEAFKPKTDEPLQNPNLIYPPGLVPISYMLGHPMSLNPNITNGKI